MKNILLTINEYAKKYKITRQGVYHRIGAGIIPKNDIVLIPRLGVGVIVKIIDKNHKK